MKRIFYGWYIALAMLAALFIHDGAGFYSFGVFFIALLDEFNWSRASTSGAQSLCFFVAGFLGPLVGKMVQKFGPRSTMISGAVVMGGSFFLLGTVRELWQLYVCYVIMAVGLAASGFIPVSDTISNWFVTKRGTAMGVATAGIGLGGLVMVPLSSYFISNLGWQWAYAILGIMIWAIMIPVVAFFVRYKPEHMGLLPDGEEMPSIGASQHGANAAASEPREKVDSYTQWTVALAMKSRVFWIIAGSFILVAFGQSSVLMHQVAFMRDIGIDPQVAATALGLTAALGIVGKLAFGFLADRFPIRHVMMLCFGLQAVGVVVLMTTKAIGSPYPFVVVFGFAMGGVVALEPLIVAKCFGLASFGVILGIVFLLGTIGHSLGPPMAGYIFDVTGSYYRAFVAFIITYILATIVIFFAKPPKHFPGHHAE